MIPISKPTITRADIDAVIKTLKSGNLAQGERVKEFENKFATYIKTEHAVAVSNGTSALQAALTSLNLRGEDEVITTPFSFIASSNAILFANARPIFADVNLDDFNLNVGEVEKKITKNTKAILVVHLFGQSADMAPILKLAKNKRLIVVEDACQSHGAMYKTQLVGGIGHIGCFSFYPTKNMTTGEGGMVTTNSKKLYEKMLLYRNHGQQVRYYHNTLGYNFRMTDISASLGVSQLNNLESNIKKRIRNAQYLTKHLSKIEGIITPTTLKGRRHVYNQYTLRITKGSPVSREDLTEKLSAQGIGYGIYYPVIIPNQALYKKMGYTANFPNANKLTSEVLSLPVHPGVTRKNLDRIISVIRKAVKDDNKKK
ncbi:MAG: DegT/DnrJ/EryC1/StrS family aminotransferase [Patescibacteria group bacterium]